MATDWWRVSHSPGFGRRNIVEFWIFWEVSGLHGLARRKIENSRDLDPDRKLVGMRHAVAYFGKYKPFLGSNLYDRPGFQGLRHQQLHTVLRVIKKLPLDLDHGRTKHPDSKCLIRGKADLGPTVIPVQAIPLVRLAAGPACNLRRQPN